ncbi:hypothetical protein [Bacteriophage sp.]|nr:hypothetical protein [Caudoviricetes sp.]UOF79843.1 hypothetical protein [Bacteriophage sp.]UOF81354.1 hypothetical protein [Caudoviricetes sp.]
MTPSERTAYTAQRKADAAQAVKTGNYPAGLRVKVGDFTLTLTPVGTTEKGSVSYGHSPIVVTVNGRQVRVNRISLSVLPAQAVESMADLEAGEVW